MTTGTRPGVPEGASPAPGLDRPAFRALQAATLVVVPLLLAAFLVGTPFVLLGDDAFITLAYARNLADGNGLVFHPGERVWGFTSPLNTLWTAGLALLPGSLPKWAAISSALWLAGACALGYLLLRRRLSAPSALLAVAFLVTHPSLWVYHGMEGTLLVCLQGAFLWLALHDRSRLAALVGSLSCLARPDSLLLVLPVLLARRDLRRPVPLLLFAGPGILWCAFAWAYYGQVLPTSLGAKAALTELQPSLSALAKWITRPPWELAAAWPFRVATGLGVASLLVLWRPIRGTGPLLWALTVYPWILILVYAAIGVPLGHYWEVHSATFFYTLGWAAGLALLAERAWKGLAARVSEGSRRALRNALRFGFPVALAVLLVIGTGACLRLFDRQGTEAYTGARHDAYREIARWIEARGDSVRSLAYGEVGTLGYYTRVAIVDTSGLVTPGIRDPATGERRSTPWFIRRYRPSHVLLPGDHPELVLDSLRYVRVAELPARGFLPFTMLEEVRAEAGDPSAAGERPPAP